MGGCKNLTLDPSRQLLIKRAERIYQTAQSDVPHQHCEKGTQFLCGSQQCCCQIRIWSNGQALQSKLIVASAAMFFVLARVPHFADYLPTSLIDKIEFFGFVLPNCSFVL
jgi:hypothetical protein